MVRKQFRRAAVSLIVPGLLLVAFLAVAGGGVDRWSLAATVVGAFFGTFSVGVGLVTLLVTAVSAYLRLRQRTTCE
jgi:hypothetical protein